MQSLRWYIGRLRAMSPAEIVWRLKSEFLSIEERARVSFGLIPQTKIDPAVLSTGFAVTDMQIGAWKQAGIDEQKLEWLTALIKQADEIVDHKLSYFDLQSVSIGKPINWHYDHSANIQSPVIYSKKIDYRDASRAGDCKLVWEPNRHHQFVVLGRAYRATGDNKYAEALIAQLESWIEANPFGKGMNWRSPLELGLRLINWVWALDLITGADAYTDELRERILAVIYQHCWDVSRKFSQGTSANNHLVGEAAGVYIATCYFPHMQNATKWRAQSKAILEEQIKLQTYPDGCTREQALGYEFFVIQFYVYSGLVGRWANDEFSTDYWSTIETMYDFVAALAGGGNLPMFGDRDDGYVLDLGNIPDDVPSNLAVAAILFERADLAAQAGDVSETACWLFGELAVDNFNALSAEQNTRQLTSKAFKDSGYHLLQYGESGTDNAVSVMMDCGELGFGAIAAHGHADALSCVLRVAGTDVLIEPGTYDYFTYPAWREYFRKTRAHNTIEVDGLDQSEMLGPFLWSKRANSRVVEWQPAAEGGGALTAEHDGYTRLNDALRHERKVQLSASNGEMLVTDKLLCQGDHQIALYLHLSPDCQISKTENSRYQISVAGRTLTLSLPESLTVEEFHGSEDPIAGWFSPGYHQKVAVTTLRASGSISGTTELSWRISGLNL